MNYLLALLLLFMISIEAYPQSGWFPLQSGETEHIISIQFIDAQTGYYISTSNACFRTTNGGAQWDLVEIFGSDISDMKFLNAATGYVTACGGNVYRTTNSGIEWNAYNTGTSYCFNSITFLNSLTGWIAAYAGGNVATIFKTLNGGVNWFFLSTVQGIENVYRIQFTDVQTGLIGGGKNNDYDGVLLRTTNGGANWVSSLLTAKVIDDFIFVNAQTGWAISGGDVLRSTNGGLNWIGQVHVAGHFSDCFFVDVNTGWAQGLSGSDGIIYKTTNSGLNWSSQTAYGSYNLLTMHFINAQTGWTAGLLGKMYKTTNGGNLITGITANEEEIPEGYSLSQNYPNPFNPVTNIIFILPEGGFVKLTIFDIQGREIETLVNENLSAGTYNTEWNAAKYSSGVFFCKLQAGEYSDIKKMILVK